MLYEKGGLVRLGGLYLVMLVSQKIRYLNAIYLSVSLLWSVFCSVEVVTDRISPVPACRTAEQVVKRKAGRKGVVFTNK
jgi:hypothetical protein